GAPPSACTKYSPLSWSRINWPRRYPLRPATDVIGDRARACTIRRIGCRLPSDSLISGRTITSKTTRALTGLAGSRNVGTPSGPAPPKAPAGSGIHPAPAAPHPPEPGQPRPPRLGGRSPARAGDHHDLGAIDLPLDDLAELLGVAADDADAVDLRAGVAAR